MKNFFKELSERLAQRDQPIDDAILWDNGEEEAFISDIDGLTIAAAKQSKRESTNEVIDANANARGYVLPDVDADMRETVYNLFPTQGINNPILGFANIGTHIRRMFGAAVNDLAEAPMPPEEESILEASVLPDTFRQMRRIP